MLIYLCLSSHGYGHAARQAAIFNQLYKLNPNLKLVVSSIINYQFLNIAFEGVPVIHRRIRWDIGTVQRHALETDYDQTLFQLNLFEKTIENIINEEIKWIKNFKLPVLILGDIPPSAAELANKLDTHLIWMSNFGWDDIYEKFPSPFDQYTQKYKEQYSKGGYLLRFPFSLKMNWQIEEVSVGLISANPKKLTHKFLNHISSTNKPLVLVCFGGIGVEFDYSLYKLWPDITFLEFSSKTFEKEKNNKGLFNVVTIPFPFRALDLIPYCSRVICKPGFSTFCEAISNRVGVHAVNRDGFPESNSLTRGLQDYAFHRLLSRQSFMSGEWELDKLLIPPSKKNLISKDGAYFSAQKIIEFIIKNFN
tara:strand:- start:6616 stop:7707 length:1092 start_codon:yes stop_codon:yes gene_type:complete